MHVERISFTRSVKTIVFWGLADVSNFHTMRFEIYIFFLWIRGVVAEADVLASY